MSDRVSVTTAIAAPPERVFEMVADLTRMCEWSPETTEVTWKGGATGPALGARFSGKNRNERHGWSTDGRVTVCEAPRSFAFLTTAVGLRVAEWSYDVEATEGGCEVTETWIDKRGWVAKVLGGPVSGVSDRATHNRETMLATLAALKAAAESAG